MSDWRALSSELIYETPWIKVRRDQVLNHTGKELTYSVVELQSPSVFILAINAKHEVLLQRNYRYTIDKTMWGIPSGQSEGQDLLEAAKRELAEEAGLASNDWTLLSTLYQAVGIGKLPATFFAAQGISPIKHTEEEVEQILEHRFFSGKEIEDMIRKNAFHETTVLAALYLAKARGLL